MSSRTYTFDTTITVKEQKDGSYTITGKGKFSLKRSVTSPIKTIASNGMLKISSTGLDFIGTVTGSQEIETISESGYTAPKDYGTFHARKYRKK